MWIQTESAFPQGGTFYSRQNTFSLPLLRLDNDGTASGPKTTPNTLDWHLLALFAGRLKVTYQGFDSHPDTYFMAEAEIKKLRSANLFWINQPNNLNLRTKSFLLFRLLENCLIIKFNSEADNLFCKNSIYVQLCQYWSLLLLDNWKACHQVVSEMSPRRWNLKYAECGICTSRDINAKGPLRNAKGVSVRETE